MHRFIFVLDGQVKVQVTGNTPSIIELHPDDFAYFPPGLAHTITSDHGGGLMVYERIYAIKVTPLPLFQFWSNGVLGVLQGLRFA